MNKEEYEVSCVMKERARNRGIMASQKPNAKAIRRFRTQPYPNRTVNEALEKWGIDTHAKVPDEQGAFKTVSGSEEGSA